MHDAFFASYQRQYFCIVDGLICGEGDGPLFPRPRAVDWLLFGTDPFAIDTTLAWFMGFDPARLPVLREREANGSGHGDASPSGVDSATDWQRRAHNARDGTPPGRRPADVTCPCIGGRRHTPPGVRLNRPRG